MAGKTLSRYMILGSIIVLIGIGVILSMFYGQYRWVTTGIVSSSVTQHGESLAASFERRARGQLYRVADAIAESGINSAGGATRFLTTAIADNDTLIGLRYTHIDGSMIESGLISEEPAEGNVLWQPQQLFMKFPVNRNGVNIGTLSGGFDLATLIAENEAFEEQLVELGTESRQTKKQKLCLRFQFE